MHVPYPQYRYDVQGNLASELHQDILKSDDVVGGAPFCIWNMDAMGMFESSLVHTGFQGIFDVPINEMDAVCTSLSKRVYPK